MRTIEDIAYAHTDVKTLMLDLYLPDDVEGLAPLIVWIHGGGWRSGDRRTGCHAKRLVPYGYAVASVSYRLSHEATFPAQIHDCKAGLRWLRAHAQKYDLDPDHVGAWGPSAGGHLAALLGTSGGVPEMEGNLGHAEYASDVQAVCDWFGPTDFLRMDEQSGDMNHRAPDSPESQLIGAPVLERRDLVTAASPLTYIDGNEPPFLIMHGDEDRTVIHSQSVLLYEALEEVGVEVTLYTLAGAGHGGEAFASDETIERVRRFFDQHLRSDIAAA